MQMKCVKLYLRQEQETLNYDNCSLALTAFHFQRNEDSNPVIGEKGKLHSGDEIKIEVIFENI
jgi:hypothetical protein